MISMITTGSMRGKDELLQFSQFICQPDSIIEASCPHLEQKREVFCQWKTDLAVEANSADLGVSKCIKLLSSQKGKSLPRNS